MSGDLRPNPFGWHDGALGLLLVAALTFVVAASAGMSRGPAVTLSTPMRVPLVDREALAAHADSAGVPRAGAYALAWMESRDGRKGNAVRGVGQVVVDTTKPPTIEMRCHALDLCEPVTVFPTKRVCREIGRMQINPCAKLWRGNPRCATERVRASIEDNYACGLWYYRTLLDRHRGDQRRALSRYNGGNPQYANDALALAGEWWFKGLLAEEDR